jgi:hypothetical protein
VGHFGVFEVEFLFEGERRTAIDFNARFYGQMGFELRRGLPLPLFAWLGACGEERELRERVLAAAASADGPGAIYCHRVVFELLLLERRLARGAAAAETERWRRWYAENRAGAVDASADSVDWLPGWVHTAAELRAAAGALVRRLRARASRRATQGAA